MTRLAVGPVEAFRYGDIALRGGPQMLDGPNASLPVNRQTASVLRALIRSHQAGQVLSKDAILEVLYPDPDDEPGRADCVCNVVLHTLRKQLRLAGSAVRVRNVYGVGYHLTGEQAATTLRIMTAEQAMALDGILSGRAGNDPQGMIAAA